jgi:hypothetical protein
MNREKIVDYLDSKFWEYKQYECMPENEVGYEYIPRDKLYKIVDGLIPMVKQMIKSNLQSNTPSGMVSDETDISHTIELLEAEIDSCSYEYKHGNHPHGLETYYSAKVLSHKTVLKWLRSRLMDDKIKKDYFKPDEDGVM